MNQIPYTQYLQKKIEEFRVGDPIFIQELGKEIAEEYHMDHKKACAAAAVAIKRLMDTLTDLRCFGKGVYYLTNQTPFGETGINKEKLIEMKYLHDNNGYETGASIMHKLGLTSLMPAERVFVSNMAWNRVRKDEALGIVVRPPKVTVDKENRLYLQFLDMLTIYDEIPVDAENPYGILNGIVRARGLEYGRLLQFADRHYSGNTVLQLAHVASSEGVRI